MRGENDKWLTR